MIRLLVVVTLALIGLPAQAETFESADCLILPSREIELGATVPGLLAEVAADRGDRVHAGQIVARLRSDVQAATVELARAQAANDSAVQAAQARLDFEAQELQRAEDLVRRRVISEQAVDERRTSYQLRLLELDEARTNFEIAALELQRAEAELEVRQIRSPIDGIVTARARDSGEYLRDDGSVLTIAQLDPLRVEVFLPQQHYGAIAVGDSVQIVSDTSGGKSVAAMVEIIDPVIDPSSATFGVRLNLPNPEGAIVGGLRCAAQFGEAS